MKCCGHGVAVITAMLLLACHEPVPPTPEVERPVVELAPIKVQPVPAGSIVSIADAALLERAGVPGVFVLRNGLARFQMVKPGRRGAGEVEILSGLSGGETLLIGELAVVKDGSPVKMPE